MPEHFTAYASGLGLGLGLIIAIGAQNAFVLIQSIRREHHFFVAAVCTAVDILLIGTGVLGIGSLVASHPLLRSAVGIGGAFFLIWYGVCALRSARESQAMCLDQSDFIPKTKKTVLLTTLALSLLNPHVYLDTVVMVGAISGHYPGSGRYFFGLGAITASTLWFFSLAKCGSLLAPIFTKAIAWKILYLLVCCTVWLIALGLFFDAWTTLSSYLAK